MPTSIKKNRDSKKHDLKSWPEFFEPCMDGSKNFEIRLNDRDYQAGDIVILREFIPCDYCKAQGRVRDDVPDASSNDYSTCQKCKGKKGKYTGRSGLFKIKHVLKTHIGLKNGYCIFGIMKLKKLK